MKSLKLHLFLWLVHYVFHCIGYFGIFSIKMSSVSLLIFLYDVVIKAIVFYVTLFGLIPFLFEKKQYLKFSILTIINICVFTFISNFIDNYLPIMEGDPSVGFTYLEKYVSTLIEIMEVFPFVFVFWNVRKILLQENVRKQIEQENYSLEQSIMETQLKSLKGQINPDFLFQRLDYFYEQALPYSPNLSKGITLLADMMHYVIDDNDNKGRVSLQKEINHILNFIEINQLRFDGRLQVKINIVGVEEKHEIMPLVLITFIENAFKYGELFDANNPLRVALRVEDNTLYFTTHNHTRNGPKEQSEGIGISNTQRRLSLGYAESYSLTIKHEANFYEVALNLKL